MPPPLATPEIHLMGPHEPATVFVRLAQLHAEQITGGFLTSLGTPLLGRLYRAISQSPNAFILTASVGDRVVGFLCGSLNTRRVYRDVLAHSWIYLLPTIAARILSWRTLQRCWETLRYPTRRTATDLPQAEILNFCVAQDQQRHGVGRLLFAAMEKEFARRGVRDISIVTGATQLSAISFYEKIGASAAGTIEVHAHVESRLFRYAISVYKSVHGLKP